MLKWIVVGCVVLASGLAGSTAEARQDSCDKDSSRSSTWVYLDSGVPALNISGLRKEVGDLHNEYRLWLLSNRKTQRKATFAFTNGAKSKVTYVIRFPRVVAMAYRCVFDQKNTASKNRVVVGMRMDARNVHKFNAEDTYVLNMLKAYDLYARTGKQKQFSWGFKLQTGTQYHKLGVIVDFARVTAINKVGGAVPTVSTCCPPAVRKDLAGY